MVRDAPRSARLLRTQRRNRRPDGDDLRDRADRGGVRLSRIPDAHPVRVVGPIGVLIAAWPFVFAHLGKPELELFSTLGGGLVYGWLAWRTRSVVWGAIGHTYILTLVTLAAARAIPARRRGGRGDRGQLRAARITSERSSTSMSCRFAAARIRLAAEFLAVLLWKSVWPNREIAFRTWSGSLIGRWRSPLTVDVGERRCRAAPRAGWWTGRTWWNLLERRPSSAPGHGNRPNRRPRRACDGSIECGCGTARRRLDAQARAAPSATPALDLGVDIERHHRAVLLVSPHASRGTRHMISNSLPSGSAP